MKRLRATVEGRVQGVGYRDFVRTQARNLHLKGWVRNLPNGNVEVTAEGEDVALAHLVIMLEKGPSMSRIDDVQVAYSASTGEFSEFHVRY